MTVTHLPRRIVSIALLVGAGVSLFLAQSAYWINHTVFDQRSFTSITTTELLRDSSRQAIATALVDKALDDRPLVKRLVGERAVALADGLLGSDLSAQALNTISNKTYAYATSSERQDVVLDLSSIKTVLGALIEIAQTQGAGDRLVAADNALPNEIVLLESDSFPDLSGVVKAMLWLAPLFWLATITLFGAFVYVGRANYAKRVYLVGLTIAGVAVFGLLSSPFIPPPVAAAIPNISLRPAAVNLASGFLAPFYTQMWYMLATVIVVLALFNQRFAILNLARRATDAITPANSKKPGKTKR